MSRNSLLVIRVAAVLMIVLLSVIAAGCTPSNITDGPTSRQDQAEGSSSTAKKDASASGAATASSPNAEHVVAKPRSMLQSKPAEAKGQGPRLQVDFDSVDYGDVAYNDLVDQTFQLRNVGQEPLIIQRVAIKTVEGC